MKLFDFVKMFRGGADVKLYWEDGSKALSHCEMIPIELGRTDVKKFSVNVHPAYAFQNPANWDVELEVYLDESGRPKWY